jgi:hypothetical protein
MLGDLVPVMIAQQTYLSSNYLIFFRSEPLFLFPRLHHERRPGGPRVGVLHPENGAFFDFLIALAVILNFFRVRTIGLPPRKTETIGQTNSDVSAT